MENKEIKENICKKCEHYVVYTLIHGTWENAHRFCPKINTLFTDNQLITKCNKFKKDEK